MRNLPAPAKRAIASAALAIAALGFSAQAQAPLDIRIALVIGNSAYPGAPLVNPANDARAMGDTLRGLGFTVIELRDAQKVQMAQAISQVRESLNGKQGVGMLYYAGHGLQLDWRNYMVPVDAKVSQAADVPQQTVDINSVIDAFKSAGNRMNILVLDACRDNPFAGTASAKGLAQLDAPPGTFLAFATAPGNVADDGDAQSGNGLYTRFLLDELKKPVSKIEDVFKRVRFNVRQKSQGRQVPWESTSLEDDFFFNTGKVIAIAKPAEDAREVAFTQEKSDWDRIKDSTSADAFYTFLNKYPSGFMSEQAQYRVELLQKALTVAVADQTGQVQSGFLARYRNADTYRVVFKDGLTNVEKGRPLLTIRQLGEDEFEGRVNEVSVARTDRAGFISRDAGGTYDPPYATVPGGIFQVGKKWTSRSIRTLPNGSTQWVDIDARIVAREKVTVPMGTADTYRIEVVMAYQDGGRAINTYWLEPEWGIATRYTREFRARGATAPEITVREVISRFRTN